ncbi:MAG: hypothetical protein J6W24_08960 [Prevotella sp.]|nr:hypothetical protein [Prevotella sp.]
MSAFTFVACGDDDGPSGGGGSNSNILGSWTLTEVTPANSQGGPGVGTVMTFYANGKFTSNGDEGTFTYDNDSKAFSARIGTVTISGTVNISGSSANAAVTVTAGGQSMSYTYTMEKNGSSSGDDDSGDDDDEVNVNSTKMVGTWEVMMNDDPDYPLVGQSITFKKNGTCTISNSNETFTYTCEEELKDGYTRLRFTISNGASGKLVLVSEGNVLNGEYKKSSNSDYLKIVAKKSSYTYPTGGIKGRWKMTQCSMEGAPVGRVMVFGNNGEMYTEGDPHIDAYSYSGNTLTLMLSGGQQFGGTVSINGNTATLNAGSMTATLQKQ